MKRAFVPREGIVGMYPTRFPAAMEWPTTGLPGNYLPLLAPHRKAFVREDEHLVSHGGLSVEEIIVPLVQIERKGA